MSVKSFFKKSFVFKKIKSKIAKHSNNNNIPIFSSIIATFLVSSTILTIRQLGGLQSLELLAYDFIVQITKKNHTDPRLLIVEITDQDIKNQNQWPISDKTFAQLIQKLQQYEPKVIGLDIYRDISHPPGTKELKAQLQKDNIITIEALGGNRKQISAPPNIPRSRIGFNDLLLDEDNVVRRNLVYAQVGEQKLYSFGLRLSLAYLKDNKINHAPDLPATSEGLYINNVLIKPFKPNSGGYQMEPQEALGLQTLINYQSPNIAQKVTLTEVLADQIDPNLVKDKIVIIGSTAPSIKDFFDTPYSSYEKTQSGVIVHAQMVSQILSLVLDNKTQFWFWTETSESLWIVLWAIVGATIAHSTIHKLSLVSVQNQN